MFIKKGEKRNRTMKGGKLSGCIWTAQAKKYRPGFYLKARGGIFLPAAEAVKLADAVHPRPHVYKQCVRDYQCGHRFHYDNRARDDNGVMPSFYLHGNRAAIAQYGLLFLKDGRGRFDRGAQHNIGAVADAA